MNPPGGKALIIGAYGGDHVGDTAILGGVLLYLARIRRSKLKCSATSPTPRGL